MVLEQLTLWDVNWVSCGEIFFFDLHFMMIILISRNRSSKLLLLENKPSHVFFWRRHCGTAQVNNHHLVVIFHLPMNGQILSRDSSIDLAAVSSSQPKPIVRKKCEPERSPPPTPYYFVCCQEGVHHERRIGQPMKARVRNGKHGLCAHVELNGLDCATCQTNWRSYRASKLGWLGWIGTR